MRNVISVRSYSRFWLSNHLLSTPIHPILSDCLHTLHPALVIHNTFALRPRYSIVLFASYYHLPNVSIQIVLINWSIWQQPSVRRSISWRYSSTISNRVVDLLSPNASLINDDHLTLADSRFNVSRFAHMLCSRTLIIVYPPPNHHHRSVVLIETVITANATRL